MANSKTTLMKRLFWRAKRANLRHIWKEIISVKKFHSASWCDLYWNSIFPNLKLQYFTSPEVLHLLSTSSDNPPVHTYMASLLAIYGDVGHQEIWSQKVFGDVVGTTRYTSAIFSLCKFKHFALLLGRTLPPTRRCCVKLWLCTLSNIVCKT